MRPGAPVPVLPPEELGRVHFIAAGGSGMSGVARLYLDRGLPVTGSDQAASAELAALGAAGADVWVGHDPARMAGADTVVYSTAVPAEDPELAAARARGARLWHRSAALAALMLGHDGVAVAGTHGKTTTSGMVVTALAGLGADPSYVIGSPLAATGRSAAWGRGPCFVVEADESDGSFLQYPARVAVVTTVDVDHLDFWGDAVGYRAGFGRFVRGATVEVVVISADDPAAAALAVEAKAEGRAVVTFGESPTADLRLTGLALDGLHPAADLRLAEGTVRLRLGVPGRHNLHNAAAAVAAVVALGLDGAAAAASLSAFTGTARRFEPKGEAGGVSVVDDYAHHPAEIAATLAAARAVAGRRRLVAVFQPHLFSRTRDFADAFGSALAAADVVVVTDVYPAREQPLPGVTGRLVADAVAVHGGAVEYVPSLAQVPAAVAARARPGDLVVTLGAGSITTVGPALLDLLEAA